MGSGEGAHGIGVLFYADAKALVRKVQKRYKASVSAERNQLVPLAVGKICARGVVAASVQQNDAVCWQVR